MATPLKDRVEEFARKLRARLETIPGMPSLDDGKAVWAYHVPVHNICQGVALIDRNLYRAMGLMLLGLEQLTNCESKFSDEKFAVLADMKPEAKQLNEVVGFYEDARCAWELAGRSDFRAIPRYLANFEESLARAGLVPADLGVDAAQLERVRRRHELVCPREKVQA